MQPIRSTPGSVGVTGGQQGHPSGIKGIAMALLEGFIGTIEDEDEVEIENAESEQDDVCKNH